MASDQRSCPNTVHLCLKKEAELLLKIQGVPVTKESFQLELLTATNYTAWHLIQEYLRKKNSTYTYDLSKVACTFKRALIILHGSESSQNNAWEPYKGDSREAKDEFIDLIIEVVSGFLKTEHIDATSTAVELSLFRLIVFVLLTLVSIETYYDASECANFLLHTDEALITRLRPVAESCVTVLKKYQDQSDASFCDAVSPVILEMDSISLYEVAVIINGILQAREEHTEEDEELFISSAEESTVAAILKCIIKGYHFLRKGNIKAAEHEFLQCCKGGRCLGQLNAVALGKNGHGICLLIAGKPALALQMFKIANNAFEKNKAPMLNMVTALRQLDQTRAEIESTTLLYKLAKLEGENFEGENLCGTTHVFDVCIDVIARILLPFLEDRSVSPELPVCAYYCEKLDPRTLLYRLGSSLYRSKRYRESADAYLELLKSISLGRIPKECTGNNKGIQDIYYKCIQSLLLVGDYVAAMRISDHVLNYGLPTGAVVLKEHHGCEIREEFKINLPFDVKATILKAEILRNLGSYTESLSLLSKIENYIMLENLHHLLPPPSKRARLTATLTSDPHVRVHSLQVQVLNNLGVVYMTMGRKTEAFGKFVDTIKRCQDIVPDEVRQNFCKWVYMDKGRELAWKNWNSIAQKSSYTAAQFDDILTKDYQAIL